MVKTDERARFDRERDAEIAALKRLYEVSQSRAEIAISSFDRTTKEQNTEIATLKQLYGVSQSRAEIAISSFDRAAKERDAALADAKRLREALLRVAGAADDPSVGWRGRSSPHPDLFSCEYCGEWHVDCTEIPHKPECPVLQARAALAATGETRA